MEQKIMIVSKDIDTILENSNTQNALGEIGTDITWCGYTVAVKRVLPFAEMMHFVDGVVAGCFATSDGSYMPEVRDIYFRCSIVGFYTNIELPDSIEDKNKIVYGTDIIDMILQNVDKGQFRAIMDGIEKKIDYLVNTDVKRIENEVKASTDEIIMQCEELNKVFSGIGTDEMADFIKSVTKMNFDEKAVIGAYAELEQKAKKEQKVEQRDKLKVVK